MKRRAKRRPEPHEKCYTWPSAIIPDFGRLSLLGIITADKCEQVVGVRNNRTADEAADLVEAGIDQIDGAKFIDISCFVGDGRFLTVIAAMRARFDGAGPHERVRTMKAPWCRCQQCEKRRDAINRFDPPDPDDPEPLALVIDGKALRDDRARSWLEPRAAVAGGDNPLGL